MDVRKIIGVVVVLVVALILTPLIVDIANDIAATVTGATQTIVNMIPVFYVLMCLGIAAFALKGLWKK